MNTHIFTNLEKKLLLSLGINFEKLSVEDFQKKVTAKILDLQGKVNFSQNRLEISKQKIEANPVRCPDSKVAQKMIAEIEQAKKNQDSLGGIIKGVIKNLPVGLGEPEFGKLPSRLAEAMMSINATKGFEIGSGFGASSMKGSQHNDIFEKPKGHQIKAITFDIDGVLSLGGNNLQHSLERHPQLKEARTHFRSFWYEVFPKLSSGKGKIEQELKPFLEKIHWTGGVHKFIDFWHKTDFSPNQKLLSFVQNLKSRGFRVFIASQQEPKRAQFLKNQFKDIFDGWFVSYDLGCTKDNPDFFKKIASLLNLETKNILHIDDKDKVVDLASSLGFQTILYTPKCRSEVQDYQKPTQDLNFIQILEKLNKPKTEELIAKINQKIIEGSKIETKTNYAGGSLGGISNGQEVDFRVAIKPVATISKTQSTVTKDGQTVEFEGKGRHDPCVLPRAVPIVESMAALVVMDLWLLDKKSFIN